MTTWSIATGGGPHTRHLVTDGRALCGWDSPYTVWAAVTDPAVFRPCKKCLAREATS